MKIFKLVLIGFITTLLRSILQVIIPAGQQTILKPSIFVNNGTMPLAFMVYGTFAYTLIAGIFLILHNNMGGNRIIKGLKFGVSCSLLWAMYLMEPLPHVANIDRITYPIADSVALIFMGILLGRFMAISSSSKKYKLTKNSLFNVAIITMSFFLGRMIQYTILCIYSSFNKSSTPYIVWIIGTGIVIGLVFDYLNPLIKSKSIITKSLIFGFVIFGVDLFAFNFFMPIVFHADILDLFIRTIVDIIFVFIGSCIINNIRNTETVVQ